MAEAPIPNDWPELRASFVLGMRAARRSPRTITGYVGSCDAYARFLVQRSPGRLVEESTRDDLRAFLVELEDRGNAPNHALRHTATHHMLDRGMSEHNVATQLGHKSLKMLGRYGRARATGRSRDDFFRTSER